MARISLNARNITKIELQPNNLEAIDITGIVTSADATYSSYSIPDSGLSLITGTLVLNQGSQQIDFDDRYNEIFNRGVRLNFQYTDPNTSNSYNFPIIGTTYIISSQYDFKSTLSLDIGCVLALMNFLTPQDLAVCIEIGSEVTVSFAIQELLKAAGIPDSQIDATSFDNLLAIPRLVEPLAVDQGQSIIDLAAQLAGEHGTIIYQDNTGTVKLADYKNLDNKGIMFSKSARDLHIYSRGQSLQSKVKKLVVNWNEQVICSNPSLTSQQLVQGDIRTEISVSRDDLARTVTRTVQEFQTVNAVESLLTTSTETSTYEPETSASASAVRIGNALPNGDCYPEDPGRLLSTVRISTTDNTNVLKSWLGVQESALTASGFAPAGTITSERTDINWSYPDDNTFIRTETEFAPFGKAVPLAGDRQYGNAGKTAATDKNPEDLIILQQNIQKWTRANTFCTSWVYTLEQWTNQVAVDPEYVSALANDVTTVLNDVTDGSQILLRTRREINNNSSAPSPPTFPEQVNVEQQPNELILGTDNGTGSGLGTGTGFGFDVVERKFFGNFYEWPLAQITLTAQQYMDFKNGRILGVRMSDSPFAMNFDCWADFVPLFKSKIIEPYREDRAGIFVADTPTITITPEEVAVGWYGIFLGFNTNLNDPTDTSFIKTGNQPSSDVDVFLPSPVSWSSDLQERIEEI